MELFQTYLDLIEKCIGHKNATFTSELERIGKTLFPQKFLGVFARDKKPPLSHNGYMIVNLDNSNEPGSHWIAIANDMFYDSFGRSARQLKFHEDFISTEDDPEQALHELNCGARCLAWLCVYHTAGPLIAYTI